MKKLIGLLIIAVALTFISANTQHSGNRYEYATVDSDAPAAGYWTNEVNVKRKNASQMYFSVRDISSMSMTITLQFICPGDAAWTDYATYTAVTRVKIEGPAAGVRWRAGVKDADWTSGTSKFGFDW